MSQGTVHVVISARNREWILPKWLESLENQTLKPSMITIVDNSAPNEEAQTNWLKEMSLQGRLGYVPFPAKEGSGWVRGEYGKQEFVDFTNKCFQVFLDGPCDWLFFFDTDQTCGPDALERLTSLENTSAGLVIRTNKGPGIYNFLGRAIDRKPYEPNYDRRSLRLRQDVFNPYPKLERTSPFRVDFVSGAVFMHRMAVEKVRCLPDHPSWEWGGVWDLYYGTGFYPPIIDPRVSTAHYMIQGEPPLEWPS